jgi:hypothetical protein
MAAAVAVAVVKAQADRRPAERANLRLAERAARRRNSNLTSPATAANQL